MNPMNLFRMKGLWDKFTQNHPKFPLFLQAVGKNAIAEGTIMEFKITTAQGETYSSNLKLTASDMELLEEMKDLMGNMQ
ncbi:MAG: hypothetical protein IJ036_03840 [Lachnospiraceae bacterium]|nr:hypothetical protein [Lachnospiraceae bacterium]